MKKPSLPLDELLTVKQAAQFLQLAPGTLNRWRVEGQGPRFAYLGRHVRYAKNELAAWVAAKTRQSTSDAA